jgi:hypothetical protein
MFLKSSVDLQAALAAETHLAEGQRLNTYVGAGGGIPPVSRTEGQPLMPLQVLLVTSPGIQFTLI